MSEVIDEEETIKYNHRKKKAYQANKSSVIERDEVEQTLQRRNDKQRAGPISNSNEVNTL